MGGRGWGGVGGWWLWHHRHLVTSGCLKYPPILSRVKKSSQSKSSRCNPLDLVWEGNQNRHKDSEKPGCAEDSLNILAQWLSVHTFCHNQGRHVHLSVLGRTKSQLQLNHSLIEENCLKTFEKIKLWQDINNLTWIIESVNEIRLYI